MAEYMYGVREDGSVVSIKDINFAESGLRCKCKCPQCHRDLQACSLQENKVSRYFRHNNEGCKRDGIDSLNGCTATSANESGLHMMAKELIAETRKIAFPSMAIAIEQLKLPYSKDILIRLPQSIPLRSDFVFECNEVVEVEKPYPLFRPDVSVSGNGETFLIEIAVTHRVSVDKQEVVQNYGLPMLEIDLSGYMETGISRDELRKVISEDLDHKKWISLFKELLDNVCTNLTDQAARIKKEWEELAARRKAYFIPETYAATLSGNRIDRVFDQYAKRNLHFSVTHDNYPFFIDIPITGEVIFDCDRRIWQGKVFDRWVYNRKAESSSINLLSVWDSLIKENHLPIHYDLSGKFLYPGVAEPTYLPYAVIRKFFEYLERLGFISTQGQWATVLEKHSLVPPDQEYAAHLKKVLDQADGHSPLVTDNIDQKLTAILRAERERTAELERERQRVETEQLRLKAEAEKKSVEVERQKQIEAMQESIRNADYDQTDHDIIIGGQRWLRCTRCNQPRKEGDMVMLGFPTHNKGVCRNCAMRREKWNNLFCCF